MKFSEWQKQNQYTNTELAKKLGIHVSYITHIHAGRKKPALGLALKIEQLTRGKVTVEELFYP